MPQIQRKTFLLLFLAALITVFIKPVSAEQDIDGLHELVNKAHTSLQNFVSDPNMGWFRSHIKDAKAVFIVPQWVR